MLSAVIFIVSVLVLILSWALLLVCSVLGIIISTARPWAEGAFVCTLASCIIILTIFMSTLHEKQFLSYALIPTCLSEVAILTLGFKALHDNHSPRTVLIKMCMILHSTILAILVGHALSYIQLTEG